MRDSFISVLAVGLLALSPAFAAADDSAARAKAALELAKAKAAQAKEKAKGAEELLVNPRTVEPKAEAKDPLTAAKDKAKATGSPMFVSTCSTCVETCGDEIRKLGPVVKSDSNGDAKQPFFRVQVWDGESGWYIHDWNKLPSAEEAAAKAKELQGYVKKPPRIQDVKSGDFRISLPVAPAAAECVGNT